VLQLSQHLNQVANLLDHLRRFSKF